MIVSGEISAGRAGNLMHFLGALDAIPDKGPETPTHHHEHHPRCNEADRAEKRLNPTDGPSDQHNYDINHKLTRERNW